MRLNNRGWGLGSMLWALAAIIIFFIIAVILLNYLFGLLEEGLSESNESFGLNNIVWQISV